MKKNILVLFFFLAANAFSQQIYIEAGKTISSFDYKNSQGVRLDNLQATSNSFMSVGYRSKSLVKKAKILFGVSYVGYGAVGSDDSVGNYMEWDINYLEFNTGLDSKMQ